MRLRVQDYILKCMAFIAINLVNSSSSYAYDARTQTYGQPAFAQQLLKRFVDVNEAHVRSLATQAAYTFDDGREFSSGAQVMDLINLGLENQNQAPTVLTALLDELAKQTT